MFIVAQLAVQILIFKVLLLIASEVTERQFKCDIYLNNNKPG